MAPFNSMLDFWILGPLSDNGIAKWSFSSQHYIKINTDETLQFSTQSSSSSRHVDVETPTHPQHADGVCSGVLRIVNSQNPTFACWHISRLFAPLDLGSGPVYQGVNFMFGVVQLNGFKVSPAGTNMPLFYTPNWSKCHRKHRKEWFLR